MSVLNLNWTSNRIHSLRLRLGWSCSDLARRLNCSSLEVLKWEQKELIPEEKYFSLLEFMEIQAEEVSNEMQICPLAESILESSSQDQILLDELM